MALLALAGCGFGTIVDQGQTCGSFAEEEISCTGEHVSGEAMPETQLQITAIVEQVGEEEIDVA